MRAPDKDGYSGEAWKITIASDLPHNQAGLATWLLHVPSAHPVWSFYLLGVVSTKDIPGIPTATKHYPEAEYEFLISAIAPDTIPDPDDPPFQILEPINVAEQFDGVSDEYSTRIAEDAVEMILKGIISPDSDFRKDWKRGISVAVEMYRGK